jgi:putative ABC transport system permease protein
MTRAIRALLARLVSSLRAIVGLRPDDDLRAELESHLQLHIDESIRRGMSFDEARRNALLAAGGLTVAAELGHERRGLPVVENFATDLRYALRALRSKPGYTAAVVLTLALGIGANSAMFTIVNAVVLRPLPYPRPDRIVSLSVSQKGEDIGVADDRSYFAWHDGARSLTLAAFAAMEGIVTTRAAGPESMRGMQITESYFSVLGVRPLTGRTFTADEYRPHGARVAMLSEGLWRRAFGADSSILGHTVEIDGAPATVVGIMPASLATQRPVMFWLPYRIEPPSNPSSTFFYFVLGRLRDGASMDAARAELLHISRQIDGQRSVPDRGIAPVLMTWHDRRYGDRRKPLLLFLSAVGVLLLIACANLANLTLARSADRQRETAVRLALGAGKWRVVRGMLYESALLSLGGALLGLVLGVTSIKYVVRLSPASVGNVGDIHLDAIVLLFTLVVAVATAGAFGFIPAVIAARAKVHQALSSGGPRSGGSKAQQFARRVLVVAQLATTLVLLTAAGLVTRTFWRVASIDTGFRSDHLIAATFRLPQSRYSPETAAPFLSELLARARRQPGVESAALVDAPPLMGGMTITTTDSAGRRSPPTTVVRVGPDYFRTIGATIQAGRAIDSTDRPGTTPAVVVNATLARRLFPSGSAVGRTVPLRGTNSLIVGVVHDVIQRDFEAAPAGAAYQPLAQSEMSTYMNLVVRTSGPIEPVETELTHIVQSIDRALAPPAFKAMSDAVAEEIAPRRFTFVLLSIFAALATALATIGLYGVLAHVVASRTREIGIRVALGADPRRVTRMVLWQGVVLALVGVGIGAIASTFTVRTVRTLVYGMSVYDPWTFAAGATLLIGVCLAASYVPARRASRVDPVIALRAD